MKCYKFTKSIENANPYKLKLILIIITIILLIAAITNNIIFNSSNNLISFIIMHFLGYLFFLLLPVEGLYLYYLNINYNFIILFTTAIITALLAQTADYILGALASENMKKLIKPQRYNNLKKKLCKHGIIIIFLFNLLPISSPIVVLISGILRIKYNKVLLVSFAGLSIKYLTIAVIYCIFSN